MSDLCKFKKEIIKNIFTINPIAVIFIIKLKSVGEIPINFNGENNVEWLDKSVAADEIDSHLWGFVGNIFDGYKVVNKGSGNAIKSTGGGAATMASVADATVFVAMTSQNTTEGTFCLRYPNGNYLNAQGEGVYHYSDNDNGSSFFFWLSPRMSLIFS